MFQNASVVCQLDPGNSCTVNEVVGAGSFKANPDYKTLYFQVDLGYRAPPMFLPLDMYNLYGIEGWTHYESINVTSPDGKTIGCVDFECLNSIPTNKKHNNDPNQIYPVPTGG